MRVQKEPKREVGKAKRKQPAQNSRGANAKRIKVEAPVIEIDDEESEPTQRKLPKKPSGSSYAALNQDVSESRTQILSICAIFFLDVHKTAYATSKAHTRNRGANSRNSNLYVRRGLR